MSVEGDHNAIKKKPFYVPIPFYFRTIRFPKEQI